MKRVDLIIEAVAKELNIPKERIYGSGNKNTKKDTLATAARWKIIHELKNKERPLSYPQIGQYLKIDHSTVIYAARKMKETDGAYVDNKLQKLCNASKRTSKLRNREFNIAKLKEAFASGIHFNPEIHKW